MCYKNIAGRFFGLVTKHACDRRTDGRTEGQNYDSQDRSSIAASRGKNQNRKSGFGQRHMVLQSMAEATAMRCQQGALVLAYLTITPGIMK